MCGIVGFILKKKITSFDQSLILKMSDELFNRGPDSHGYWINDDKTQQLGHRRLKIIDLSENGFQPMKSKNGRFILTYNGEIYNHEAIRRNIDIKVKYKWRSSSDTETLLASLEIFGFEETLKSLKGMFAFGLIDNLKKKLYLARDLSGEKPLYYGFSGEDFVFSSELKPIMKFPNFKKKIDLNALNYFLKFSYVPEPLSIFEKIFKLEKNKYLEFDLVSKKIINHKSYKSALDLETHNNEKSKDIVNDLNNVLRNSIKLSLTSDVEVGTFLSGGTDSSLITAIMKSISGKNIKSFSVNVDSSKYNERIYSKSIANYLKTEHNEITLSESELIKQTKSISNMYDEPFADSSQIPTSLVSKFASSKVKVILSGDGADEYFGGYNRYLGIIKIKKFFDLSPHFLRKGIGTLLLKMPKGLVNNFEDYFLKFNNREKKFVQMNEKIFKLSSILINCKSIHDVPFTILKNYGFGDDLIKNNYTSKLENSIEKQIHSIINKNLSIVENMMKIDQNFYLQNDILNKVDRASMHYSLETRMPFLNPDVIKFANNLDFNFKIKNGQSKWILKELLKKYIPYEYVERPKMGFSIPLDLWLRKSLKNWTYKVLDLKKIENLNLLDKDKVDEMLKMHMSEKKNYGTQLWNLIVLQNWIDKFI